MDYEYPGTVHHDLRDAYHADAHPSPTRTDLRFPRREHLRDEVAVLKRLLFPRCWNASELVADPEAVHEQVAALGQHYYAGIVPYGHDDPQGAVDTVLDRLPTIRGRIKKDVEAAYKGDPAAKSHLEVIRSYPGFHAIMVQRVAHELYERGATEYARELTEDAKSETGIDIHPGAEIGEYFFIDHGTGVVIGETTTVGDWARIYQNVTLGALHFEEAEDEEHMLSKGYKRHPNIGDHVVIGAGSKVLGAIAIGDHVSIGANSWVTEDVSDHTSVFIAEHPKQTRKSRDATSR